MVDPLSGSPILEGVVLATIGVLFWVGGLLLANWLWQHLRGDDTE